MITLSIVINCYREGDLIYNAINSVYNQTDQDFDIVIVNDCSPDEITNRICREIEQSGKAEIIWKDVNEGHGLSRNTAFENIDTDAIIFIDADDTLPDNAVSKIREVFNLHPEADFVFGSYKMTHIETGITETVDCSVLADESGKLSPYKLANNWRLLGCSPCKKRLWQKAGGYAQDFSNTTNDLDFWQRAILSGATGYYVNTEIYHYNQSIHGINLSPAFKKAIEICNYKNFDFTLYYNANYKEAFSIALYRKDYNKIKRWANYEIREKRTNTMFAKFFYLCPKAFIPFFARLYEFRKKVLKKTR